jgi:hypothetical protein
MRLHGTGGGGWSIEVRGAEGLAPGPYWALFVCGARPGWGWLELAKHRPSFNGKAATGGPNQAFTTPSGHSAQLFGVVVGTANRGVRYPERAERLAARRGSSWRFQARA